MHEDLEQLKQRIPLLEYLQRRRWTGCRVAAREEFVGLSRCIPMPSLRSMLMPARICSIVTAVIAAVI